MFIETHLHAKRTGWVEIICGPMFSGKTEELFRRLRRAEIAQLNIAVVKPAADNRYDTSHVVSHDKNQYESIVVQNAGEIIHATQFADVIGIDEAQFFDNGIVDSCKQLANNGKRVIIAGLDMDFQGNPFGPVPQLMSVAEYVTKVHAICGRCGNLATFSYRKTNEKDILLVGEKNIYEPLCRGCYNASKQNDNA